MVLEKPTRNCAERDSKAIDNLSFLTTAKTIVWLAVEQSALDTRLAVFCDIAIVD